MAEPAKHCPTCTCPAGTPCSSCGATVEVCDNLIRRQGRGCCSRCYSTDTHRLLTADGHNL